MKTNDSNIPSVRLCIVAFVWMFWKILSCVDAMSISVVERASFLISGSLKPVPHAWSHLLSRRSGQLREELEVSWQNWKFVVNSTIVDVERLLSWKIWKGISETVGLLRRSVPTKDVNLKWIKEIYYIMKLLCVNIAVFSVTVAAI